MTTSSEPRAIVAHPSDNVATLLDMVERPGHVALIDHALAVIGTIKLQATVEIAHKVAIREIAKGTPVIKFGEHIGIAMSTIRPGDHVHVHNISSVRFASKAK